MRIAYAEVGDLPYSLFQVLNLKQRGVPYFRIADGLYPYGSIRWLNANDVPSTNAIETHFLINNIILMDNKII